MYCANCWTLSSALYHRTDHYFTVQTIDWTHFVSAVDYINAVTHGVGHVFLNETAEAGQVGRDRGNAHYCALGRCVTPRLVVRGKDT